ncbi:hypothetical protein [Tunturiibacter psychrotolerans]|uniref:hypothetical protein n=1 Tax=Tunturiibacter psychrotolerans TaxID=3069686 RepID=UPI003D208D20
MASGANDVDIVVGLKASTYTAGMKEIKKSLGDLDKQTKEWSAHTVSSQQAASAGIRLMENPLGNQLRALERLIASSKVLSGVFKAAFPVVGLIAAGSLVAKLGTDVVKFIETAQKMPKAMTDGFASLHLAARTATDSLSLANDQLQETINKLEGKSQGKNILAMQLDEARIKADELAKSSEDALSRVTALLEANKLGALDAAMTGQGRTASTAGSVRSYFDQINVMSGANNNAVHQYGADSPQAKQAASDLAAKQASFDQWLTRRMAVLNDPNLAKGDELEAIGGFGNQDGNKAIVTAAQSIRNDQKDSQTQQDRHAQLVPQEKAAQAAAEANRKAAEAARKAAEEMAKGWAEDQELFKKWQDYEAENVKISGEDYRDREKNNFLSTDDNNQLNQAGNGSAARIAAMRQSIDVNKENSDLIAQQAIDMQLATGQISRMDAARQQATIHTNEYTAALEKLQAQAEYIKGDKSYTSEEARQAALLNNQTQQGQLGVSRGIQVDQDNQKTNPNPSSAAAGFDDAINDFVTASRDAAAQMRDITENTLKGLNDTILHVLTTPHMTGRQTRDAFGNYGAGLAKSVAGTALQKGEGSLMGLFGGGKLGTKGNAMHVIVDSGGSPIPGVAGSVLKSATSGGGVSGFIGSMLKHVLPGFAAGGQIDGPAIVGENGPELYVGHGTVVPNHKLVSSGGGGGDIHFHPGAIDARGASDPAQVDAAVRRGIAKAAPSLTAASVKAVNEHNRRTGK